MVFLIDDLSWLAILAAICLGSIPIGGVVLTVIGLLILGGVIYLCVVA